MCKENNDLAPKGEDFNEESLNEEVIHKEACLSNKTQEEDLKTLDSLDSELVPQQKKWHVFYVRSRHEKRVYDDLVESKYLAYLPIRKVLKQWSQRKKIVEEPLFKSYIFVYITPNKIPLILEHYSVVTYISFGGKPATVREQHIKLIKKLIRTNAQFNITSEKYKVGDKLKIEHGAFKGFEGIITEIRGKKKYVVNLEEIEYSLVVDFKTE